MKRIYGFIRVLLLECVQKSILVPAFLLLLFSSYSACALSPHYEQAQTYEKEERWEEAYTEYVKSVEAKEVVKTWPEQEAPYRAFLIATKYLGRHGEGTQLLLSSLEENPEPHHYYQLAEFYGRIGKYDDARNTYQIAYDYYLANTNYFMCSKTLQTIADSYIGEISSLDYYDRIQVQKRNYSKAFEYLQRVLEINPKLPIEKQRIYAKWIALRDLAYIYGNKDFNNHDPRKAREFNEEAAAIKSAMTDKSAFEKDNYSLINRYMGEGKYEEALTLADNLGEQNSQREWVYERLQTIYLESGNLEKAFEINRKGRELLNLQRSKLKTDVEKLIHQRKLWNWYADHGIKLAGRLNKPEEAVNIMETSIGRAMLDLLGNRDSSKKEAWLETKNQERAQLLSRAGDIQTRLKTEKDLLQSEEGKSLERSLVLIEDKAEKLKARVDTTRREIVSAQTVDPVNFEEARKLAGDYTLIIFWNGLHAAIITKEDVKVRYIRGSSYFPKLVKDVRDAVTQQGRIARGLDIEAGPGATIPTDHLAAAQELYRILIRPIQSYIKPGPVYIIPGRMLHLIPFQMLHDGEKYFIEEHPIVYAPSISVLKYCIDKRQPIGNKLLALGNPNLKEAQYKLVHAEEEVSSLINIFPEAEILIRDQASEGAVDLLGSDADIIHFACHGEQNMEDPALSCLRLAPDGENDGFLHAYEIFDLNISAAIVILSACETALGEITQGNEVLGLTRAWMYAGAPSVIASLWRVDDLATKELMKNFYQGLLTQGPAEALQSAQVQMIKDGQPPYKWAPFCLYGDPGEIKRTYTLESEIIEPSAPAHTASDSAIPWQEAKKYYGKSVTVEGTVQDTYNSSRVTILYFNSPLSDFSMGQLDKFKIAIFPKDISNFPEAPDILYAGRKLQVTGIVKKYDNVPEIVVTSPKQITVVE